MNKLVKYLLIAIVVFLTGFFSLRIENLSEYKSTSAAEAFNATKYAKNFWEKDLPFAIQEASDISQLIEVLREDPKVAFDRYGKKLGITKTAYFMVKGSGIVKALEEECIIIEIDETEEIQLATDFIFGNAVRDGSGKVSINDYVNMTDFNNTSVAINKLIKDKVIPGIRESAFKGKEIEFAGAVEIREDQIQLDSLRVIPVNFKASDE